MGRSDVPGGFRDTTKLDPVWNGHGGSQDITYDKGGSAKDITHHTPDGGSHTHDISHTPGGSPTPGRRRD